MKQYPQYSDDLQEYVGILYELNECKKKLALFLQSLGIEPGDRQGYWSIILSTPQLDARRRLFMEEQALDAHWNKLRVPGWVRAAKLHQTDQL